MNHEIGIVREAAAEMSDKRRKGKKRRGRNALTFYEKIAVIRHHDANQMSRNSLARIFQCCTTQIRRILERKEELLAQWQAMSETDAQAVVEEMTRKRREFEMKAVGFILHQWVERCRQLQLNTVINNNTLKIVALKTATLLNLPAFRPTARWIDKFRTKYKYSDENLENPKSTEDPQGVLSVEDIIIEFKHYLPSFMQQEITNLTVNSAREGVVPAPVEESPMEDFDCQQFVKEASDDSNENGAYQDVEQLTAEDVLQHLSVIQQFLVFNSDYCAMVMTTQLEDHIRANYTVPGSAPTADTSEDDRDDIILLE